MKRFENKIVIITGVNDVSREISSTFAAEGCKVVITGNEKDLEKIADEAIDKFNQIDILPNGHEAVRKEGENNNSSVQNVDYIFNTNLRSIITGAIDATDGAYNVRDSAKKVFLASRRSIVNSVLQVSKRFSFGRRINKSNDPSKLPKLDEFDTDKIRNFSVIAHVDHGKSTLTDRILQEANVIDKNEKIAQVLDKLLIEQQRGITVKAQTCSIIYKDHLINLIDSPGHVDFSFEVARSLAACDGVILLIAANSGCQAQTISNFWLAFERDMTIIPVLNKVDLKTARVDDSLKELETLFCIEKNEVLCISAKSGMGVPEVLDAVIDRIPSPKADRNLPFQAIIFDSWYEHFRGAIVLILVKNGSITKGQHIASFNNKKTYEVVEVGVNHPDQIPCEKLYAGQIGYLICNMKTVKEAAVGETLYEPSAIDSIKDIEIFNPAKPTIYSAIFPVESSYYEDVKQAIERLCLNDPSITISPTSSPSLGLGWSCGFLGILHMEIFSSRLDQEYDVDVILTAPSIEYRARIVDNDTIRKKRYNGESEISIVNAASFPEIMDVEQFMESYINLTILVPSEYMGVVNAMCSGARGKRGDLTCIDDKRMILNWHMPLAEVVTGFFEKLKQLTSGYASFSYEFDGYEPSDLTKLSIHINNRLIEEFSQVVPVSMAHERAKTIVNRLKTEIPRQQYEVNIKCTLGDSSKMVCGSTIKCWKKDFSGLLKGNFGGGGMERLNKKLSHQAKGKSKLKMLGQIQIPKEAFINVLKN
uniref:Translation factor GUF1 homolog, mitochondrial n=1 Tax=Rhabditophanes sp. KR3021 TaxID=114890 RepID=A0AC35UHN3_9BILA